MSEMISLLQYWQKVENHDLYHQWKNCSCSVYRVRNTLIDLTPDFQEPDLVAHGVVKSDIDWLNPAISLKWNLYMFQNKIVKLLILDLKEVNIYGWWLNSLKTNGGH